MAVDSRNEDGALAVVSPADEKHEVHVEVRGALDVVQSTMLSDIYIFI